MIVGIILLGVGAIFLLKNLGIIQVSSNFTDILYPLIIIIIGAYFIIGSLKVRKFKENRDKYFKKKDE